MRTTFNQIIVGGLMFLTLTACSKESQTILPIEPPVRPTFNLYHLPASGWVGDVMPYYNNGQFDIYYLNDATDQEKQASTGQHPIHRWSTTNLFDIKDEGEVIPYGSVYTQDHLIGTGSMVEEGGTAYFYYTGHNGSSTWLKSNNPEWAQANPREAIMYASRIDGQQWTKSNTPILYAPDGYDRNDFRDPYVFYNEEFDEYWMLVSGRKDGKGYLLRYTTQDLKQQQWDFQGVLDVEGDYLMLECADIFKAGNTYFMLFAEDWSATPGTRYRVASSSLGPWKKPTHDRLDGHHFYAAKTASDGTNRYAFAWAHRRTPENDGGERTWGGNLITHEIYTASPEKLAVKFPSLLADKLNKPLTMDVEDKAGNVREEGGQFMLDEQAELSFPSLEGTLRMEMDLQANGIYSLRFGDNYEVSIDIGQGEIAGYNGSEEATSLTYDFSNTDAQHVVCVVDGSILVVYINNEVALTNRIYSMQGKGWKLVATQGTVLASDVKVFGL